MFCLSGLLVIYATFGLHSWIQIKYLQDSKNVRFGVARVIQHIAKTEDYIHADTALVFSLLCFFSASDFTMFTKLRKAGPFLVYRKENAKINKLMKRQCSKMLRKELDQKFGPQ